MYKILIVEDDPVISSATEKHLSSWGYACRCVKDFLHVMEEYTSFAPELVLMDIGLPRYDGYYWCQQIRKVSKTPIIFLSSMSDQMNIVMAINMGGDDFISKPFDVRVLTAKVSAVLRRTYEFRGADALVQYGGAVLDKNRASLLFGEKQAELTKNEYRILQVLMEHGGSIVSREELMEELWSTDDYVDDSALSVCMTRLRKKLEGIGLKDYIATKRGVGYQVQQT